MCYFLNLWTLFSSLDYDLGFDRFVQLCIGFTLCCGFICFIYLNYKIENLDFNFYYARINKDVIIITIMVIIIKIIRLTSIPLLLFFVELLDLSFHSRLVKKTAASKTAYCNPNFWDFVISTGACAETIIWGPIKILPKPMVFWILKTY